MKGLQTIKGYPLWRLMYVYEVAKGFVNDLVVNVVEENARVIHVIKAQEEKRVSIHNVERCV